MDEEHHQPRDNRTHGGTPRLLNGRAASSQPRQATNQPAGAQRSLANTAAAPVAALQKKIDRWYYCNCSRGKTSLSTAVLQKNTTAAVPLLD